MYVDLINFVVISKSMYIVKTRQFYIVRYFVFYKLDVPIEIRVVKTSALIVIFGSRSIFLKLEVDSCSAGFGHSLTFHFSCLL